MIDMVNSSYQIPIIMVWYRATEQPWIPALTDITTTERIMMSIFSLVVIVVNQVYGL